MKINEVENLVGITKKNIRFYEEEGLLTPSRNKENGYRDYSQKEVDLLFTIKLLRKLAIPIEEIRKLFRDEMELNECLKRQINRMNAEQNSLDEKKKICQAIISSTENNNSKTMNVFLNQIAQLEKEGHEFLDIKKNDKKKEKVVAIIAAGTMLSLFVAFVWVMVWAMCYEDTVPIGIVIFTLVFPMVSIIGICIALVQRIKEIAGGEEDEASKY